MFKKLFAKKEISLSGAPPVRRLKTYSAQSGYVFQYYYEGQRVREHDTEFVFTISADRTHWTPARVLLDAAAISTWECSHERTLQANERYGIAKMALFQAFDTRETPSLMASEVLVGETDIETIVGMLEL